MNRRITFARAAAVASSLALAGTYIGCRTMNTPPPSASAAPSDHEAERQQTLMYSSKSAPIVTPAPQRPTVLPGSKSAEVFPHPKQGATAPTPQRK